LVIGQIVDHKKQETYSDNYVEIKKFSKGKTYTYLQLYIM